MGLFFGKFGWLSNSRNSSSQPLRRKTTSGISWIIRCPSYHKCNDLIRSLPITKCTECVSLYFNYSWSKSIAVGIVGPLSTSIGSTTTGKVAGKKSRTASYTIWSLCWGVEWFCLSGLAPQGTIRTSSNPNRFIVSAATYSKRRIKLDFMKGSLSCDCCDLPGDARSWVGQRTLQGWPFSFWFGWQPACRLAKLGLIEGAFLLFLFAFADFKTLVCQFLD